MSMKADSMMRQSRIDHPELMKKYRGHHNGTLRKEDGSPKFTGKPHGPPNRKAARKLAIRVAAWDADKGPGKGKKPGSLKVGGGV
jgi:hypothetical protein